MSQIDQYIKLKLNAWFHENQSLQKTIDQESLYCWAPFISLPVDLLVAQCLYALNIQILLELGHKKHKWTILRVGSIIVATV